MPVRIVPAPHEATGFAVLNAVRTPKSMLGTVCPHLAKPQTKKERRNCTSREPLDVVSSSFDDAESTRNVRPDKNGLLHAFLDAYNQHRHLIIRPEDIWFAVLSQFSIYVNAHAEELRGTFVAHQGQERLVVGHYRGAFDFAVFCQKISDKLQRNVLDLELRRWMMPYFSTTTRADKLIAAVMMMGSMQKYFTYGSMAECGIPSVTLLGEREDYVRLLAKTEGLRKFGDEPTMFADLLRPIISRMVGSFDNPEGPETIDFWQKIAFKQNNSSGPRIYTGWMCAFAFWDDQGGCLYLNEDWARLDRMDAEEERMAAYGKTHGYADTERDLGGCRLELDGIRYHHLQKIPNGYVECPMFIDEEAGPVQHTMIAGSVGIASSHSGIGDGASGRLHDTVQPVAGWFFCLGEADKSEWDW